MHKLVILLAFLAGAWGAAADEATSQPVPTLWIIGDSTVNSSGNGMCGWGNVIASRFDTSKINIVNKARGGRSSRTFYNEGLWDAVSKEIRNGDFVLMQFGHNDAGPLEGDPKGRRSLPGTGEETKEVNTPNSQEKEIVHTFGWYMRHFTKDAMGKGASVIILSPIPRDNWRDGRVLRTTRDFTEWGSRIAAEEKAGFIDLNNLIATRYEALGAAEVKKFFTASERDRTHTSKEGAEFNADTLVEAIKAFQASRLRDYVR